MLLNLFFIIDAIVGGIAFAFPHEIFGYLYLMANIPVVGLWILNEAVKALDERSYRNEADFF